MEKTNQEKMIEHISKCEVCCRWIGLLMVQPLRCYPTLGDILSVEIENLLNRINYYEEHKELLIAHGMSSEQCFDLKDALQNLLNKAELYHAEYRDVREYR